MSLYCAFEISPRENCGSEATGCVPPKTLYKTIVEECRTRSKYTGGVSNFTDLIKFKSITRSQVEGWLDQVRSLHAVPSWAEVSTHLNVGGMELGELSREWRRYRAIALDAGNEAINALRDKIRDQLELIGTTSPSLDTLIDVVYGKVEDLAIASLPPFKPRPKMTKSPQPPQ
jgi:hypothetical protein